MILTNFIFDVYIKCFKHKKGSPGFECICKDGYRADDADCIWDNDCENGQVTCGTNEICNDTPGVGADCNCEEGNVSKFPKYQFFKVVLLKMVYGHLQQPGFGGPPKFRSFAAKPFAAVICSNQNRSFAAKPFASVICSNHLQQK